MLLVISGPCFTRINVREQMLVLAVKAYTTQDPKNFPWVKIQMHVPGRTDVQCRERWVNILDPSINAGPWTEEVALCPAPALKQS